MEHCILCASPATYYCQDKRRFYLQCSHCRLVYVPKHYHLTQAQEKAEYDLHENSLHDEGYRRFLSRMAEPVSALFPAGADGLDFGSGPAPALADMLRDRGFNLSVFDKYYANQSSVLEREYDFITATEVVEHLAEPRQVLEKLWQCLRPTGVLGVMTKRVTDLDSFQRWHYKNDPTHICFFAEHTFQYLASELGAILTVVGRDVVLLRKGV